MVRQKTPILSDHYYHIYNRGNQREDIFLERENYIYFLKKFRQYFNGITDVLCYCLMPNHFHLLLKPLNDEFSRKMQNFTISYVKSINKRYNRVGHLFQANFKAKLIEDNNVLLHLSRYIHLNPVFGKLVSTPENWEFSSYREYIKQRNGTFPQSEFVLSQFRDHLDYKEFVESYQREHLGIIKEYVIE